MDGGRELELDDLNENEEIMLQKENCFSVGARFVEFDKLENELVVIRNGKLRRYNLGAIRKVRLKRRHEVDLT